MLKARLCHLLLGFNTLYKSDLFHYCDASNCSDFLSINIDQIKILACDHTYHISCYNNNGSKYLYCLLFIQNSIDKHVKSLLDHL